MKFLPDSPKLEQAFGSYLHEESLRKASIGNGLKPARSITSGLRVMSEQGLQLLRFPMDGYFVE